MKKKSLLISLSWAGIAIIACVALSCSKNDVQVDTNSQPNPLKSVSLPSISSKAYAISGLSTSSSNNATAIQNAINAANAGGGGTVTVPSGTYNCGPLTLKSNVGLTLASGCTLKVLAYGSYPGSGGTASLAAFISLNGQTNVLINGSGTIDGQGSAWWSAYTTTKAAGAAIARPCMVGMGTTTTAEVSGIKIINAPNGHMSTGKSSNNITITGVTLSSPSTSPNTDGIDIWSPNVNITNCNISCGDDNIAMDSGSTYVTITGCTFGTGHGCSIGSYASGIDHITVNSCTFNGTSNGIHIKSSRDRGGVVQYLTYSNITMTNVASPIIICGYYPDSSIPSSASSAPSATVTSTTPNFKHIAISNVTATGATNAITLWGLPEQYISDITFTTVKISSKYGITANFVTGCVFSGSAITVSSGSKIYSSYDASISGTY